MMAIASALMGAFFLVACGPTLSGQLAAPSAQQQSQTRYDQELSQSSIESEVARVRQALKARIALQTHRANAMRPIPQAPAPNPLISNSYFETDILQVIQDLSLEAHIPILADETVQGVVSLEFTDRPLSEVLEHISIPLGLLVTWTGSYYVLSSSDVESPSFLSIATTDYYRPVHTLSKHLVSFLPNMYEPYIKLSDRDDVIAVTAPPTLSQRILGNLRQNDIAAKQILVEAIVTELSEEAQMTLGFSNQNQPLPDNAATAGISGTTGLVLTASSYFLNPTAMFSTLRMLEQSGRASIISKPRIIATAGEEATLFIGEERFFATQTGPANFPFVTVEKVAAGITLKFKAFPLASGEIIITFHNVEVSTVTVDSQGFPVVNRRSGATSIRVQPGKTVALGGLSDWRNTRNNSGTPWLTDIPFIGWMFGKQSTVRNHHETVIFVSAQIM